MIVGVVKIVVVRGAMPIYPRQKVWIKRWSEVSIPGVVGHEAARRAGKFSYYRPGRIPREKAKSREVTHEELPHTQRKRWKAITELLVITFVG